jgi:hypothetical protein
LQLASLTQENMSVCCDCHGFLPVAWILFSEREVGEVSIFAAFKESLNGILQRLNHYEYFIGC